MPETFPPLLQWPHLLKHQKGSSTGGVEVGYSARQPRGKQSKGPEFEWEKAFLYPSLKARIWYSPQDKVHHNSVICGTLLKSFNLSFLISNGENNPRQWGHGSSNVSFSLGQCFPRHGSHVISGASELGHCGLLNLNIYKLNLKNIRKI